MIPFLMNVLPKRLEKTQTSLKWLTVVMPLLENSKKPEKDTRKRKRHKRESRDRLERKRWKYS